MYYPQELYPRPRPRRAIYAGLQMPPQLQQQAAAPRGFKPGWKFLALIFPYLKEYCANSSVHGIRYLTEPKMRYFERFIWLLILIGTISCATIVYVDLTTLYNNPRTHTTIDNTMQPVFYVPFPAVAICTRNRLDMQRLETKAMDHFLGTNATMERKEIFRRFFTAVTDVHFNDFSSLWPFFGNATLAAGVRQLDDLNVRKVLEYLNVDCEEIFVECTWRTRPHNCCEIFDLERTELGICWIFNSAVSARLRQREREDKYYPRHTANAGPGTGLNVYMHRKKSFIRSGMHGVNIMLMQPQQWSESSRMMPSNSNNRLSIVPRDTGSDERTRSMSPRERRCLFPDETDDPEYRNFPNFVYWRGNCRSRCHQEYAVEVCNCSPSLLFPVNDEDNFTDCTAADYKCLFDNRVTFAMERLNQEQEYVDNIYPKSMNCNCLNSCTQLIYDSIHSSTVMDSSDTDPNVETMHIDVYFQSPWFIKYQTHMRFTFVELLASFGGIIGLFLGASLLSAIELVYYFTIGLYFYLYNIKSTGTRTRTRTGQKAAHTPDQAPSPITIHFRHKITPTKIGY